MAYHACMILTLLTFLLAIVCGGLGALLGLGGGTFLVPALTLLLHVPIKVAVGASIVSVTASSTMAGAMSSGSGMNHIRLALILEIATTAGVLAGGLTALFMSARGLMIVFGVVTLAMAASMARRQSGDVTPVETGTLDTAFDDPYTGKEVRYGIKRVPIGLAAAFVAGNVSGMLGIGGGGIKVPVMNLAMGVPLKAAIATSNFMVGITAATSALLFYRAGIIHPDVAAPAALGVLLGARLSTVWGMKSNHGTLQRILLVVLVIVAIQMLVKAWQS